MYKGIFLFSPVSRTNLAIPFALDMTKCNNKTIWIIIHKSIRKIKSNVTIALEEIDRIIRACLYLHDYDL